MEVGLARSNHCERSLLLGVCLARDLLGVELPPEVSNRISSRADVATAAQAVARQLAPAEKDGTSPAASVRSLFWLMERPAQKLTYAAGVIFAPTLAEWRAVQFPQRLYWLYYPYRPIRLCWKYVRMGFGRS